MTGSQNMNGTNKFRFLKLEKSELLGEILWIKKGKMTLEEIAECVPLLSLDELREMEVRVMQLA